MVMVVVNRMRRGSVVVEVVAVIEEVGRTRRRTPFCIVVGGVVVVQTRRTRFGRVGVVVVEVVAFTASWRWRWQSGGGHSDVLASWLRWWLWRSDAFASSLNRRW